MSNYVYEDKKYYAFGIPQFQFIINSFPQDYDSRQYITQHDMELHISQENDFSYNISIPLYMSFCTRYPITSCSDLIPYFNSKNLLDTSFASLERDYIDKEKGYIYFNSICPYTTNSYKYYPNGTDYTFEHYGWKVNREELLIRQYGSSSLQTITIPGRYSNTRPLPDEDKIYIDTPFINLITTATDATIVLDPTATEGKFSFEDRYSCDGSIWLPPNYDGSTSASDGIKWYNKGFYGYYYAIRFPNIRNSTGSYLAYNTNVSIKGINSKMSIEQAVTKSYTAGYLYNNYLNINNVVLHADYFINSDKEGVRCPKSFSTYRGNNVFKVEISGS